MVSVAKHLGERKHHKGWRIPVQGFDHGIMMLNVSGVVKALLRIDDRLKATGTLQLNFSYIKTLSSPVLVGTTGISRRSAAHLGQTQGTAPIGATVSVKKRNGKYLADAVQERPMLARLWSTPRNSTCCQTATCHYILLPNPLDYHSRTMILENESEISLGVGPKLVSGRVETPAAILSSIIFNITWGTLSSVARIVRRTIWGTS